MAKLNVWLADKERANEEVYIDDVLLDRSNYMKSIEYDVIDYSNIKLTIKAQEGFYFDTGTLKVTIGNDTVSYWANSELWNDNKTEINIMVSVPSYSARINLAGVKFTGILEEVDPEPEPVVDLCTVFINRFENCDVYIGGVLMNLGSNSNVEYTKVEGWDNPNIIDLKIKAHEGYYFEEVAVKDEYDIVVLDSQSIGWNEDMTLFENTNFEVKFSDDELTLSELYGVPISSPVDTQIITFDNVDNVTITVNGNLVNSGSEIGEIGETVSIKFKADDRYKFTSAIKLGDVENFNIELDDSGWNSAKTEYTLSYVVKEVPLVVYVAVAEFDSGGETTIDKFTNIYNPTDSELLELSSERYYEFSGEGSVAPIDYGSYIASLYTIPFDIRSYRSDEKHSIELGGRQLNVKSFTIEENLISINIGSITVDGKYDNLYDYINTTCVLNIPYVNKIELDTSLVIDNTIDIEYVIDMYSGETTVNIYTSLTGEIMYSTNVELGSTIPFFQKSTDVVVDKGIGQRIYNNVTKPFIEVIRNIPYGDSGEFGSFTNEYEVLGNYSGYLEVDKVDIGSNCTNQEKLEIQQLLKVGVFIGV